MAYNKSHFSPTYSENSSPPRSGYSITNQTEPETWRVSITAIGRRQTNKNRISNRGRSYHTKMIIYMTITMMANSMNVETGACTIMCCAFFIVTEVRRSVEQPPRSSINSSLIFFPRVLEHRRSTFSQSHNIPFL